jgi:diguanylate cyclase (GGDEF)-like protein/PAS domain S-box-containing protein
MSDSMREAIGSLVPDPYPAPGRAPQGHSVKGDRYALLAKWLRDASDNPGGVTPSEAMTQTVRTCLDTFVHDFHLHRDRRDKVRESARRLGASIAELFRASPPAIESAQQDLLLFLHHTIADRGPDRSVLIDVSTAFAFGFAKRSRDIIFAEQRHVHASMLEAMWEAQQALHESEARFRAVFDASVVSMCLIDLDGNVHAANQSLLNMLGYELGDVHGRSPRDIIAWPTERIFEEFKQLLAGERENIEFETELRTRDGGLMWVHLATSLVRAQDDSPSYIITLVQDISDRKRSEAIIQQTDQRVRELVQNSSDVISVISQNGVVEFMSPSVRRMLGYEPDSLLGKPFIDLITGETRASFELIVDDLQDRPRHTTRAEMRAIHQDGTWRWLEVVCTNLTDVAGVGGIVVNARDVTDRKAFERQLERQAFYDSLTALPNRVAFRERLDTACAGAVAANSTVAVLFLDLDRFKLINDSLGHGGGDQTLVAVGQRIVDTLRPGEIVARFGGDEFAVLIESATMARAMQTATRIHRALQRPMPIGHRVSTVEASIGIALSDEVLACGGDLIRAADIAQYRAKRLGGATTVVFDHLMSVEAVERIDLEVGLHRALGECEIEPYFQPEVDLVTGELSGLEVLMRWNRPGHGVVAPETFVDVVDETGIIVSLGRHIMERAFRQVIAWENEGLISRDLPISINLSGRELRAADFVETLRRLLDTSQIEPHRLRLEIKDPATSVPERLRQQVVCPLLGLGVHLTIDCFGSGSDPLTQLRRMYADRIKIDRSFMAWSGETGADAAILKAIVDLANGLGVEVTAVGLETEQQVTRAREAGCHRGQGFYFAPPLPVSALPDYLAAR